MTSLIHHSCRSMLLKMSTLYNRYGDITRERKQPDLTDLVYFPCCLSELPKINNPVKVTYSLYRTNNGKLCIFQNNDC